MPTGPASSEPPRLERPPNHHERVALVGERPPQRQLRAPEQPVDDLGGPGPASARRMTQARVVERDRAPWAHVATPRLPVLATALEAVIAVDEHQVDGTSGPATAHILTARNVP